MSSPTGSGRAGTAGNWLSVPADAATVTNVEAGRGAHVSTVVKLAEALGVMPGALLDAEREVA